MKTNTATIYGAYVQSNMMFDKPYVFVPNTTLNERHEVQAGITPTAAERMAIRYITIGRGGHRNVEDETIGFWTTEELHDARDASLFKPIPFLMRTLDNMLTPAERQQYGLREVREVNGKMYEIWWALAIDTSKVSPQMLLNIINQPSKPFVPDRNNLFPEPKPLPTNTETEVSGEYGSVSSLINFILTPANVDNIVEACRILYNNPNAAIISEIGVVASAQRMVKGRGVGNGTIDYVEAICATLMSILITYHLLTATNRGVKEELEMGTTEPTLINTRVTG